MLDPTAAIAGCGTVRIIGPERVAVEHCDEYVLPGEILDGDDEMLALTIEATTECQSGGCSLSKSSGVGAAWPPFFTLPVDEHLNRNDRWARGRTQVGEPRVPFPGGAKDHCSDGTSRY